jgi:dynein heavy chain
MTDCDMGCFAGVKQNYARRCRIPIDAITFDYSCLPAGPAPEQPPAEGGAYVSGMFVEGARWDNESGMLAESEPKVGCAVHCTFGSC